MYDFSKPTKRISYRQKRAVVCWLKNGRKSKAAALREAGYSSAIIRQPHKVFGSKAVQEELDKRGFGRTGLENNLNPHTKPIAVIKKPVDIDFTQIPTETLRKLKEQLGDISYVPDMTYNYGRY